MKRTPLKRTAFKPKKRTNHNWALMRKDVFGRSSGACEARWDGCTRLAAHVHHIKRRSQGGSDESSNLLAVCAHCHHMIHTNVSEASKKGHLFVIKG
jgi:5-methylcytosine-specific restriction endonuclease McrA